MRNYHVTITGDRYPMEYNVTGSSWSVAVSRAIKLWQKRFKGSRTDQLSIRAIKGAEVSKKEDDDGADD